LQKAAKYLLFAKAETPCKYNSIHLQLKDFSQKRTVFKAPKPKNGVQKQKRKQKSGKNPKTALYFQKYTVSDISNKKKANSTILLAFCHAHNKSSIAVK
jgi:hypothetical protein